MNLIRVTVKHLARQARVVTPEGRLMFAVIAMAVSDSMYRKSHYSAMRFINSPRFGIYCGLVGLDTEWAREQIQAAHGYRVAA